MPVTETKIDPVTPTKVIVTVGTQLDPKSSYSLTVIQAKDTTGNNIQEGVNGIKEFNTPETLAINPEAALNAATASGMTASGATESGALATATSLPAT